MDGQGKTILVAEDHASNRNLLALLLEHAQYEVHPSADGYEALERMFKGVHYGLGYAQTERVRFPFPQPNPLAGYSRHHCLGLRCPFS